MTFEQATALLDAAQAVVDSWEHGDLASAVNGLENAIDNAPISPTDEEFDERMLKSYNLVEQIARMRKDGEGVDEEGEDWVMENDDAVTTVNDLIDSARSILGWPDVLPHYAATSDAGAVVLGEAV